MPSVPPPPPPVPPSTPPGWVRSPPPAGAPFGQHPSGPGPDWPGAPQAGAIGYAPQPPPPPGQARPARRWLVPLLVIGGLLVVAAGGCGVLGYRGLKALTAPIDASNRWIDAAQAGDVDAVNRLWCGPGETEANLHHLDVEHWGRAQRLNHSSIVNGRATVRGTIRYQGEATPITLNLVHLPGAGHEGWCVTGVHVGEAPPVLGPYGFD